MSRSRLSLALLELDEDEAREIERRLGPDVECRFVPLRADPGALTADVSLLDLTGTDLAEAAPRIRRARLRVRRAPVVVRVDPFDANDVGRWIEAGASDVVPRTGLDAWTLRRAIEHAAASRRLDEELARLERWRRTTRAFRRRAISRLRSIRGEFERLTRTVAEALEREVARVDEAARAFLAACEGVDEPHRRYLDVIERARQRMNLYFAAFQKLGGLREPTEPAAGVDLSGLVREVAALYGPEFDCLGGRIQVAELPTIAGHRQPLFSLFSNLIANALKYRSEAPPRVEIRARREGEHVVLSIEDNGVGLGGAGVRKAFELAEGERAGDWASGLGLGLSICRRIVEAHGGSIVFDSTRTTGACFQVRLPIEGPAEDPE